MTTAELTELTASDAIARVRAGEIAAADLWHAYRERALADDLNAYTWVSADEVAPEVAADAPLACIPVAIKDLFCTVGVPS